MWGTVVGRGALPFVSPCPQSDLLRARFPGFCPNLFADSPWLLPGYSNSHVLLSNKGTWNIGTGSGPMDKVGVGPVKAHLQVSQETQGPLLSSHPSLTRWFTLLGPGDLQITSQSSQAASLGWIPQMQGSTGPAASTRQLSLLGKPLPPLPPLSLVLHSHLSPLASESIL